MIGFTGDLIYPWHDRYDAARRVWNGAIDRYPALIARARCTGDVAAVVRFARAEGLPLSIRGGGHSAAGLAVADDALMLDLSAMKAVTVDPAARVATAAPGVLWRELDAATQAHGLATTGGVVGSTGVAGLTLGGGIGWLDRVAGLACDNLTGAEVVTADGQVLRAGATENDDLLWALRGGGGNFGVVTSFRFRLHPVTGGYGGLLGYAFDHAADVLCAYAEFAGQAPGWFALQAGLATAPPAPFMPGHLHGQRLAALFPVCFAAPDEAQRAVARLRALLPAPVVDAVGPMPYEQVQRLADPAALPGMHHYYTAEWLDGLDRQAAGALVSAFAAAPSPSSLIVLKRMGGATARVPAAATAFWYRRAAHNLDIHAQWPPGADPAPHIAWARAARAAARRVSAGGGYVNFVGADEGADRVRAAYGGNHERLAEVKAAYDPGNFFRLNHNIAPAAPAAQTRQRCGPPGAGS
jgi:FAD/FMN-containing dehydrogenase